MRDELAAVASSKWYAFPSEMHEALGMTLACTFPARVFRIAKWSNDTELWTIEDDD